MRRGAMKEVANSHERGSATARDRVSFVRQLEASQPTRSEEKKKQKESVEDDSTFVPHGIVTVERSS